jgi:hypothetical protein
MPAQKGEAEEEATAAAGLPEQIRRMWNVEPGAKQGKVAHGWKVNEGNVVESEVPECGVAGGEAAVAHAPGAAPDVGEPDVIASIIQDKGKTLLWSVAHPRSTTVLYGARICSTSRLLTSRMP